MDKIGDNKIRREEMATDGINSMSSMNAMPSLFGTAGKTNTTSNSGKSTAQSTDKTNLNYQDFLNLFVQQLKNQDPMNPMDDNQMMSQLAQMQQMENNMNLTSIVQSLSNSMMGSQLSQYASFIGKSVKVASTDGSGDISGVVKEVTNANGTVNVTLDNGQSYNAQQIKTVSS